MVFKKILKFLKRKRVAKKTNKSTKKKIRKRGIVSKTKKEKKIRKTFKKPEVKKEKLVAKVTHYFSKIKVAILKMKDSLEINDKIRVKGYTTDFMQNVTSMQINHMSIMKSKKGQEIGVLVKSKVRHNDKVYKI